MMGRLLPPPLLALLQVALLTQTAQGGLVMEGFDVVAYFSLSAGDDGVFGSADHLSSINTTLADGTALGPYDFHFSSAVNKAKFDADPWRYAPLYGGF